MDSIKGKRIWIIGASSGIGAALSAELSRQGAILTLSARRRDEMERLSAGFQQPVSVAPLDVSDSKSLHDTVETHGPFDSVIFLAAIYNPGLLENMNLGEAQRMLNINIGGLLNMIDAVYPAMRRAGQGQIVLCGSVAGYCGLPNSQPYSLTKAAIINLAQSLKVEAERYNIDVKLISPGFVRTPLTDQNDFDMPLLMEPEEAARSIAEGLRSQTFEIPFPRKFTFFVKFLSMLPYGFYFIASRHLLKKKLHKGT